jgi:hypothetical protein
LEEKIALTSFAARPICFCMNVAAAIGTSEFKAQSQFRFRNSIKK